MAKKPEIQPDLFHVAHWTLKLLQYQDFHTVSDRRVPYRFRKRLPRQ